MPSPSCRSVHSDGPPGPLRQADAFEFCFVGGDDRGRWVTVRQALALLGRIRIIAQEITDCRCFDGEGIKNAIKRVRFVNVMGKTVTFDDHNSAGRYVVLQTVLDKKVGVADIVEVK